MKKIIFIIQLKTPQYNIEVMMIQEKFLCVYNNHQYYGRHILLPS